MKVSAQLLLAGIVLLGACSGKPAKTERESEEDLSGKTVRIVFDLPGDDIGGQESQKILQNISGEITGRDLAEIESSGFGMGNMELVLRYRKRGSVEELRNVIRESYPEGRYRIENRDR